MAKVTDKQMEVLINCIGAVETGGQVYGKRRYDDYTGAYANASTEDSITIGAFAEFKSNAKALLQEIKDTYPATFSKYDTANIASDLQKSSWSGYHPAKNSEKAKAIVNIISSSDGIKIQDKRIVRLLNQYIAYAETLGVTDVDALFMCANFIHQGGNSACKRVVAKTQKPYTLDNLYAACSTDTGNQVGAYKSRQKMVYQSLKQYVSVTNNQTNNNNGGNTMTEVELRSKVANWLVPYVGISEGSTKHREILNIFNNSRLCPRYSMTIYDAWCATAVSAAFIATGLAGGSGSGKLFQCVECSCNNMISKAKTQGIWVENDAYVPRTGDVILYDWEDSGYGDNVGSSDHVGIVMSVSGNTIKVIEGNKNNTVGYRSIAVNGRFIRGFITPNYSKFASGGSSKPTTSTPTTTSTASTGTKLNNSVKWNGTVTADSLNVRTWAGTENPTCSFSPLKTGVEVGVCDSVKASDGSTWYFVKYSSKYGFVHSAHIKEKSKPAATSVKPTTTSSAKVESAASFDKSIAGKYKTTADLNMRVGAGTNKTIITTLPNGATVNCYGYYTSVSGVRWYYIAYGNKTGFVSSKYLKK